MSINIKNIKSAIKNLKENSKKRNFVQSIELTVHFRELDVKKPENRIQDKIELPNPIGKKVNIGVFANGDIALRAKRAGAEIVFGTNEIESLQKSKKEQRNIARKIDSFIAVAPLMPLIGRILGAILGPRGKMPTPISPTASIEDEIEKHKRIIFVRVRNQPILSCVIGTENMTDDKIAENIETVIRSIIRKLKRGIQNIKTLYIKTTMGPSISIPIK